MIGVEKFSDDSGTDYGYVGKIRNVNSDILREIAERDYIPVIATIGADGEGKPYNVNADMIGYFLLDLFVKVRRQNVIVQVSDERIVTS